MFLPISKSMSFTLTSCMFSVILLFSVYPFRMFSVILLFSDYKLRSISSTETLSSLIDSDILSLESSLEHDLEESDGFGSRWESRENI